MAVFATLQVLKSQTRRYTPASLIATVILLILYLCHGQSFSFNFRVYSSSRSLGVEDNIYVISLRNRHRRREDMERLRLSLGLTWTYVDALDADSLLVSHIMHWVKALRLGPPYILNESNTTRVDSRLLPDSISFEIGRAHV